MFIAGFLALASAVSAGSITEVSGGAYGRQPISFGVPRNGVATNVNPFYFAYPAGTTPIAGRAIYDAPTGGNLLLVMPHATPRPLAGPSPDSGDACSLFLSFNDAAGFPDGSAFSSNYASASVLGTTWDAADILAPGSTQANGTLIAASIASSSMSCGVALVILRGTLMAASVFAAA